MQDGGPAQTKQDNTALYVIIAIMGFMLWSQYQKPAPTPGPAPAPVVSVPKEEAVQLAATCRVLALAVEGGACQTGSDVATAWGYADEFAFAGAALSPQAMDWSRQAGRRIQTASGETGAAPVALTSSSRSAVVNALRELSRELVGR